MRHYGATLKFRKAVKPRKIEVSPLAREKTAFMYQSVYWMNLAALRAAAASFMQSPGEGNSAMGTVLTTLSPSGRPLA